MSLDSPDTSTTEVRTKRKRTASSIAFLVHSATGLWLTVLLAVVMVSGTITVLFAEIDWPVHH